MEWLEDSVTGVLQIGEWQVDAPGDALHRDGAVVRIEPRLMRLLLALARDAGQVVPVERLLAEVWPDVVVTPESVYQAIGALRRALGDDSHQPRYIANVPRKGYRLIAPVRHIDRSAGAAAESGLAAGIAESGFVPMAPARAPPTAYNGSRARWLMLAALAIAGAALVWQQQAIVPEENAPPIAVPVTSAATESAPPARRQVIALWVDDKPENNERERAAMVALTISFLLARSTDEAVETLKRRPVDLIISDMARPGDPLAAYTLLERLRNQGNTTPLVIYTGSCSEAQREDAVRRGALGCATRTSELMQLTLAVLEKAR
jgi:DNA-binding winged helix-turn-helix (wHTH) protein/CheY-like chemotaxis protein